jgi:hypothetical protein
MLLYYSPGSPLSRNPFHSRLFSVMLRRFGGGALAAGFRSSSPQGSFVVRSSANHSQPTQRHFAVVPATTIWRDPPCRCVASRFCHIHKHNVGIIRRTLSRESTVMHYLNKLIKFKKTEGIVSTNAFGRLSAVLILQLFSSSSSSNSSSSSTSSSSISSSSSTSSSSTSSSSISSSTSSSSISSSSSTSSSSISSSSSVYFLVVVVFIFYFLVVVYLVLVYFLVVFVILVLCCGILVNIDEDVLVHKQSS